MYQIQNITIPQEKRKELNDKILFLVDNNLCDKHKISKQMIYTSYTGDGGLHGLKFNEFDSFYSYTEAKKQIENGQFYTPNFLSKFIIDCLKPSNVDTIADLTCGHGSFFNWLPNHLNVYGNEIDVKSYKIAKHLYPEINLTHGDIRSYTPDTRFDLIIGNPPFGLKWNVGNTDYRSELYYILKAAELLKPAGIMCIIVPESFMSDDFSDKGAIQTVNEKFDFITSVSLPSNTFKNVGVENFSTKIMLFHRISEHVKGSKYTVTDSNIKVDSFNEATADKIYLTYVKPVQEQREKIKAKLFFETVHSTTDEDKEFQDQVKKLLFDIKQNSKINMHYAKCTDYLHKFQTQEKPDHLEWKEWEAIRITKNKVLSKFKKIVREQHKKEEDKIELVKEDYGLRLKGYSGKTKLQLGKMNITKEMSFNDMVLNEVYPFKNQKYHELWKRKIKEYKQQNKPLDEISGNSKTISFLNEFTLNDSDNGEILKLNDIQKEDLNKILQKRYGFIQWECGGGKSLAGIAFMKYQLENKRVNNAFIVAPAIAINNTWDVILKSYGMDYIKITSLKDIQSIKHGQIVIITLNMLIKYQRQIKQFIRMNNQKIALVFDESDNISNPSARRTKAVLNCFRRAKYKLLTTGTSTRNTIAEVFPQLDLLYNSSINFINYCREIYIQDKKTKELKTVTNSRYLKPYPPYLKGFKLFQRSHVPEKITVFGVGQNSQDIYSSDILKEIIDKTIVTRTFEEIVGRKIYTISQDTCKFNNAEYMLYKKVIEEFYSMSYLFKKTGNARKDSMLQIINQLNTMIKVCSTSHLFKEWSGTGYSSKFNKVIGMLGKWSNERVAIGCRFKKTVTSYVQYIREKFPNRPLFIITGDETTFKQRQQIIKQLEQTKNGILLCTQQSLSSSTNINFIDKVIVSEMAWNDAVMRQFYFRFIRYNSKNDKEVHFVTYENSIESNLLMLILNKEKLNSFMKDVELDTSELYEEYGVNFNILEMLMTKEKDDTTGRVNIRWGQQNIV